MTMIEALKYLKHRFGDNRARVSAILTDTGQTGGYIFRVGRSKLVTSPEIEEFRLALFADGIEYSETKSAAKRAAK